MGAIANGLALSGLRPYGSTFLVFSDYMRPAIRIAALMKLPVVYVYTHDSIGLGQDGPTHQPIEQLAGLRAMPGLMVIRPADANETARGLAGGAAAEGPVCLLAEPPGAADASTEATRAPKASRAAPTCSPTPRPASPQVILIASGSEVPLCVAGLRGARA